MIEQHPTTASDPAPAMAAEGVAQIDVEAVNRPELRSLFKKREPIYPKLVNDRFRAAKWLVMLVTLGIYYGLPWVRWDRGPNAPDQAVLVDFHGERFYFFFIEIWPQELYYITGLLILAAVGLFLVTALFGRVWCGYTCPQTVWTDLYIAVERLIEGDRNARIRLARAPWSWHKIIKKISKHSIWLVIAVLTGGAWIFYFHDAPSLIRDLPQGDAPFTAYFFLGLLTVTTYSLGGTLREQVCTYMCPWPRIQAAMIDEHALAVTYRSDRGEPRGSHKKGESWDGRGHCIDCRQCVAACPMGIDIRDGFQLECIQCALCIDACNEVMDKVDLPRGLIAYDTDINIARRRAGESPRFQFIRWRTASYAAILVVVGSLMLHSLLTRDFLEVNVLRDRNPNFVTLSDGRVRNGYTLKILNMHREPHSFTVRVDGLPDAQVRIIGMAEGPGVPLIEVGADTVRSLKLYLTAEPYSLAGPRTPISFIVTNTKLGTEESARSTFVRGAK